MSRKLVRHIGLLKTFTIDGRNVRTFDEFVEAANIGFIELIGGKWNGNLDALYDYLSWPDEAEYELEILGAVSCARNLGHLAQAARLLEGFDTCHPSNIVDMRICLAAAEAGQGETLFDVIKEIIDGNHGVRLVLR